MSQATVNIPLDEYKRLEASIAEINTRNADLLKQLDDARSVDPSGRVDNINKLARATLKIVQFATANLGPRDIKRWPVEAVREAAEHVKHMPDYSSHDEELVRWLITFADEIDFWETWRKANPEKEKPAPFPISDHPVVQMMAGKTATPLAAIESTPGLEVKTDPGA